MVRRYVCLFLAAAFEWARLMHLSWHRDRLNNEVRSRYCDICETHINVKSHSICVTVMLICVSS